MHEKQYAAALLIERLVHDAYPDRQPKSIMPLQWSIMRYLKSVDGAVDISTIARYLGRTTAPISRAVSTLENRGLVSKNAAVGSASKSVVLTDLGLAELERDPMLRFARWITDLPDDEGEAFLMSIRRIAMRAHEESGLDNADDTDR